MLKIKSAAAGVGLWRFEDMFSFAEHLLEYHPRVAEFARWRFPACFVDEMQDTSELQIRVLAKVFPISACLLRQRFGDVNQAIFDRGQCRATTDAFPGSVVRGITNSQRFDQTIATLVQPLAPDQSQQYLIGEGPPRLCNVCINGPMPHTVFLFAANSVQLVLPAFAQLLLDVFPPEILNSEKFLARAIGHVGRPAGETDELPHGLPDYWPEYEPEIAKAEPRPEKLTDFIHLAQRQRMITGDCTTSVATVARGIAQLIDLLVPAISTGSSRGLKGLRELLAMDQSALRSLERLFWRWCVEVVPLNEPDWLSQLHDLREALAPVIGDRRAQEARDFCKWSATFAEFAVTGIAGRPGANRYRFPEGTPRVEIDVGTIHSAKGQTHAATLVLETFFQAHDIGCLIDWLVGNKCGTGEKKNPQHLDRLRLIYTAMTRPTHLLCLALREQAIEVKRDRDTTIEAFRKRGWQVRLL